MHILYTAKIIEASEKYGKPVPVHSEYKKWIEDAGFVDVKEHFFKIPVNTWPKNKQLKEVGKYQLINYTEGYEGIGIGLFTRMLGWQPAEFQVLLARLRQELKDRSIHAYQPLYVCRALPEQKGANVDSAPSLLAGSHFPVARGSQHRDLGRTRQQAPRDRMVIRTSPRPLQSMSVIRSQS